MLYYAFVVFVPSTNVSPAFRSTMNLSKNVFFSLEMLKERFQGLRVQSKISFQKQQLFGKRF